ncbi:MAG: beta-N-acetylhexosaminidase [Desulfobacteraceae bacterium]|jgi:beta-N-acetylhexosaminidase|nr:MAG: beta-N-acetylhexosaminidase [Desulfobacteraceae bacterium]
MSNSTLELSELYGKIGRLFMAGMPGTEMDATTEFLISEYGLGGVIFFRRNIESPLQLARLCNTLQETSMKKRGIPLFLAVDQEGGRVARLIEPFTRFPGNAAIGASPDPVKEAKTFARKTALEMRLVGLNMDLAPVVDVARDAVEAHLEGRIFGNDPSSVSRLGAIVVKELQDRGVMAVAKHFPGLGAATLDPHHRLPSINVDMDELRRVDLPPFIGAAAAGVAGIMTSHAIYPAIDPSLPATLSPSVLTRLLRDELGYRGLIITDDLEMGAIAGGRGIADAAIASFMAGADILLICKDQNRILEAMHAMRDAALTNEKMLTRLNSSVARVEAAKARLMKTDIFASTEEVSAYFSRA